MAVVIRGAQLGEQAVSLALRTPARKTVPERPQAASSVPVSTVPTAPVAEETQRLEQMQQHIEATRKAADEQIRQAREQLDKERERVLAEARTEGLRQGDAQAKDAYRERLTALERLIESFRDDFGAGVAGLEDVVVAIAFEATRKMVGDVLCTHEGVVAIVREAMQRALEQERLVLHVAPADYQLLSENREVLFGRGTQLAHEIVADDRVALGGCLIETAGGTLDARIETQLQQLREALIGARKTLPE